MKTEKTSSDFIREQLPTTSAAEVVEKGKAGGVTFDASLVGKVRRRSHGRTRRTAARSPSTAPSPRSRKPVTSKAEFVRTLPSSMASGSARDHRLRGQRWAHSAHGTCKAAPLAAFYKTLAGFQPSSPHT
jgi:hypothetical protein